MWSIVADVPNDVAAVVGCGTGGGDAGKRVDVEVVAVGVVAGGDVGDDVPAYHSVVEIGMTYLDCAMTCS